MDDPATLRDVMDSISGPERPHDLYGDLAPLYAFVYERSYDHAALAAFAAERAPPGAERALVGACGTGAVLAALADEFDATGVDRAPAMLGRAAARTDAPLVRADLTEAAFPGHDLYTVFGNSLAHLPDAGALDRLFARAHESLAPGGRLLADYRAVAPFESGPVVEDRYESDRFVVDATTTAAVEERCADSLCVRTAFAYAITDRERGDTARVGLSIPTRMWERDRVHEAARAAGFDSVEAVSPPGRGAGVVAGRAP